MNQDAELLRQCRDSGQMSAAEVQAHEQAGDFESPSLKYTGLSLVIGQIDTAQFTGLYFGAGGTKSFFNVKCPCGITATYPLNGLPELDTPHPCGKPGHWVVRYEAAEGAAPK